MNTPIEMNEQRHIAAELEPILTALERLAECGFTAEESAALLWLRHWYQSGGSDRMQLVCHWEFLKRLVKAGRLEM